MKQVQHQTPRSCMCGDRHRRRAIFFAARRRANRWAALPDGGFLLNSGWRVKPAGTQIPLDTLPMSSVLSKDGRFLLVLNGGYKPPSHQRARHQRRP